MTDNTKLDIAERIAKALSSTSEPRPTGDVSVKGGEIIGSVPVHLRHLHNLLHELAHEADVAKLAYQTQKVRFDAVRTIFFDALKTQVPEPESASSIGIRVNWDVVASYRSDDDDREMGGLGELLAKALGGRC